MDGAESSVFLADKIHMSESTGWLLVQVESLTDEGFFLRLLKSMIFQLSPILDGFLHKSRLTNQPPVLKHGLLDFCPLKPPFWGALSS